MPKSAARKVGKLKVSEADIQTAVVQMLELDGWRAIRTDPVSNKARGTGFGEIGMPDYLFIRYRPEMEEPGMLGQPAFAQVLWCEFKAPGKHASPHQLEWHNTERLRGAMVLTVNDVDRFRKFYKTSGLMRHPILS